MRFSWDDKKSLLLKRTRGAGLSEAVSLFYKPHDFRIKNDDPEQYAATGWILNSLYTVVYEVREDQFGEYYHLVTLWKATKEEKKEYNRNVKS